MEMDRFKDKVVIVTGAASGIGEATTRRIVSEGGMVVMADFAKEKTALLAQDLKAEKAEVYPVYFSAENLESCRTLIGTALEKYHRIDVLVNNVGGTDLQKDKNIEDLDISYFDQATLRNLFKPTCHPGNDPAERRKYRKYSFRRRAHRRFQGHVLRSRQSRNHQLNPLYGYPNGEIQHPL